jgi:hypothetical protein
MSYQTIAQDTNPRWQGGNFSQGQANLIKNIMAERGVTPEMLLAVFPERPKTFVEGGKVIAWLKAQTKTEATPAPPSSPQAKPVVAANWDDIIDGNYAFSYNGKTHFYRVSRREGKGKWAGRTFINVQERASDDLFRIEDRKRQAAILHSIRENGPEACRMRFASELGQCCFCLKSLTDETNPYKARGAGPDCGPKYLG